MIALNVTALLPPGYDRGVNHILIAVLDGLKGFPEANTSAFPQICNTFGVRVLEGPQGDPASDQGHLSGRECRDGARSARRSSRPTGAGAIRLSAKSGGAPGIVSRRSSRSRLRSYMHGNSAPTLSHAQPERSLARACLDSQKQPEAIAHAPSLTRRHYERMSTPLIQLRADASRSAGTRR